MEIGRVSIEFFGMEEMDFASRENFTHIKTLPHFSVVQSITGNYGIQINNGKEFITEEGGIFIAPPQYEQKITHLMKEGKMRARWVFFSMEINSAFSAELLFDFPVIPSKEDTEILNNLLDSIFIADNYFDKMSICYNIGKTVINSATEREVRINNSLIPVLELMKKSYAEKLTVSQLATAANMSEPNLYAVFKKQFSRSPVAYLNDYRLSIASRLLKTTDLPLNEVSRSVGIDDVGYFSKIFKRKFLLSPNEYRKNRMI